MTGPACGNNPNHQLSDGDRRAVESFRAYLAARAALLEAADWYAQQGKTVLAAAQVATDLRRRAGAEARHVSAKPAATETDEERADREETERDHARGDHTHCGITCEVEMPTEHLRNFVIAKGYPGTKGALAELERRAAAKAPAVSLPPADQTALERVARRLASRDWLIDEMADDDWQRRGPEFRADYMAWAREVVAAVLPATTNHAAAGPKALREAADFYERVLNESLDPDSDPRYCTAVRDIVMGLRRRADEGPLSPYYEHPECGFRWHGRDGMDVPMRDGQPVCPRCELRRVADETATTETPEWARPETEEEKLAKCRRMAKALSAPPVAPSEWETTTEWPGRHKRPGDRRVHATARFVVNDTQQFWTACGERVGRGGTPMSHMPVGCRGCKRATAAGARQDGAQR
ncbi:hypothetical protein [Streptomyces sp. OM5714]|uniref:hypothetical protein n=1 Tax=Streptomyces sp. OM5714 TaxID=2602736 RepID=UPI0013DA877F|nr:hypothetical protein [Streptomyces sp. OM5714]KAF2774663.1 hypothetical protein STPH1_7708 [Streptomyces sp. OM5714]